MSLCNVRQIKKSNPPELSDQCSFERGHLGDHSWALEPSEFGRSSPPARVLVRCGCGLVRTDEDKLAALANLDSEHEFPRVCRGCSSVYMLPKQRAPSSG